MKYISNEDLIRSGKEKEKEYEKGVMKLSQYVGALISSTSRSAIHSLCYNEHSDKRYSFNIHDAARNEFSIGFVADSIDTDKLRPMFFTNKVYRVFLGDDVFRGALNIRKDYKEKGKNFTIANCLSLQTQFHLYNYYKQLQETLKENKSIRFGTVDDLIKFLRDEKIKYIERTKDNFRFDPITDIKTTLKPVCASSKVQRIYEDRKKIKENHIFSDYVIAGYELYEYMLSRELLSGKNNGDINVYTRVDNCERILRENRLDACKDKAGNVRFFYYGNVSDVLNRMKEVNAECEALRHKGIYNNNENVDIVTENDYLKSSAENFKDYLVGKFDKGFVIETDDDKNFADGSNQQEGTVTNINREPVVPARVVEKILDNKKGNNEDNNEGNNQLTLFETE